MKAERSAELLFAFCTWNMKASVQPATASAVSHSAARAVQLWRLHRAGSARNQAAYSALPPHRTAASPRVSGLTRTDPITPSASAVKSSTSTLLIASRP